eukprot:Gb_09252 [translate_table: standard]
MIKVDKSPTKSMEESIHGVMNGGRADAPSKEQKIAHRRYLLLLRMVCAEIVGTFIVMFSISAIIAIEKLSQGAIGIMEYAATGGFAIMVVIFSIGHISGAHVNPAITIAFAVVGRFPWGWVPSYMCAQFASATLATFIAKKVYNVEGELARTKPSSGTGQAFCVELIATFFIMFLASALSIDAQAIGQLSGIAVGASIALGVLITGPVSGGSMNPARSFGPAVVENNYEHIWVYMLAPTIGAVGGAIVYRLVRLQQEITPMPTSSSPSSDRNASNL